MFRRFRGFLRFRMFRGFQRFQKFHKFRNIRNIRNLQNIRKLSIKKGAVTLSVSCISVRSGISVGGGVRRRLLHSLSP